MDGWQIETSGVLKIRSTCRGHHFGNISVTDDLEFFGLVHGSVTVVSGRQLRLHGRTSGNLIVKQDALAAVHGSIMGAVLNRGAKVSVSGMAGKMRNVGNAKTYINHILNSEQEFDPGPRFADQAGLQ
jgi:hypothetical protein